MTLHGTSVLRVEDDRLLRGDQRFVADLDIPGALAVHVVTSQVAHGLLRSVEVTAARSMPGVVDVVTAADLGLGTVPPTSPAFPAAMARTLLAVDRVRFVGEPIAVVVASTAAEAADAAEQVVVDIEPLPVVIGLDSALADEHLLHPEVGTNVVATVTGGSADIHACEVVVRATFLNQRVAPCPIETRAAASRWESDGRLTHWISCQGPHPVRALLCQVHGLDPEQVRVIAPDVGGSFGAKARAYPEDLLLPWLARRVGAPVRWIPTRTQDMVGLGHSRAQRQEIAIGGDRDGTIRALTARVIADVGAFPASGPLLVGNTAKLLPGPLRLREVAWETVAVVTNTTPIVAYRGAGRPEAAALVDRALDMFAAETGLDPLEVRRRNLLTAHELPWTNPNDVIYDSGDYHRALDLLVELADYGGLRAEQARRRAAGELRQLGLGLSTFVDRTAGVPGTEYGAVELRPDGSLLVRTGSNPYGQGHHTAWAMLVADRTGVPMERIEVVHGDTDAVPRGGVTGGSRSVQKAGVAVALATDDLVVEARHHAAELLEAGVDDVVLELGAGRFHVAGAPAAATVSWAEVAVAVHRAEGDDVGLACERDFDGQGPTVPFGAYLAVVEVDTETGAVELVRMLTVDDAGTILNPMLAEGQVHGGLAQGLAQALFEEFLYDEDGNPVTSTFADYMVPSAADLPSFEGLMMESASPYNPLGAKGIAESGTIGGTPAVQNAVVDALAHLGVRHIDLPLTPERVWASLPH